MMANAPPDSLEQHKHEVCNAFARAAAAMRDAARTAENFSNWFSRVHNLQNLPVPPMFNSGQYNFLPNYPGPQQQQQLHPTQPSVPEDRKRKTPEGKKKRQTKEKKPKDVNAPKRPASAYLLFQNDVRKTVQAEHPDMTYSQVLGEISRIWHGMGVEERAPYTQATADSKVLYEKAKADYEATGPTTGAMLPASSKPKSTGAPAAAVVSKTVANTQPAKTSDSSDESSEPSSSSSDEEEEEEEEPEPPRKKPKKATKEMPKASTPSTPKAEKKSVEGKKKKKIDT